MRDASTQAGLTTGIRASQAASYSGKSNVVDIMWVMPLS
jgi:hypothetical protein